MSAPSWTDGSPRDCYDAEVNRGLTPDQLDGLHAMGVL
jgi:hypothetical protein